MLEIRCHVWKKTGFCFLFFPYNEELSTGTLVHGMLWKLRHQLAQFAGGYAGEKSLNVSLFLRYSTDATDLAAVRKKIVGWMDLSLSPCGCSSATVDGAVQSLAASFTLSGHPCSVRNGLELLAKGLTLWPAEQAFQGASFHHFIERKKKKERKKHQRIL